jgi:hypothetical protein
MTSIAQSPARAMSYGEDRRIVSACSAVENNYAIAPLRDTRVSVSVRHRDYLLEPAAAVSRGI